jgi:hypothetical protein
MDSNTRVNLQYSITIGELPEEVDRLFDKAAKSIKEVDSKQISQIAKEKDKLSLKVATQLEEMRNSLTNAVSVLEDLENIINGYVSYKTRGTSPAPARPQPAADAPTRNQGETPSVNDLMSKLNAFRNLSGNLENEEPHTIEDQEV